MASALGIYIVDANVNILAITEPTHLKNVLYANRFVWNIWNYDVLQYIDFSNRNDTDIKPLDSNRKDIVTPCLFKYLHIGYIIPYNICADTANNNP